MATNQVPNVIYESLELAKAYTENRVTPELVRAEEKAVEAMRAGDVSKEWMGTFRGLPFYMSHTAPKEDGSPIAFDSHFNPALKHDSEYFKNLNKLITCVESHAATALTVEDQNKVCGSEMKQLRLAAFRNELLYHQMNKRFYMDFVTRARGEAPY